MKKDVFIFAFSKREILTKDASRFLSFFQDLESQRLESLMGSVTFSVSGYDDDPRELFQIPEVRDFYQSLHRTWPCWLFFAETLSPSLLIVALCNLPTIQSKFVAGEGELSVQFNPLQMSQFMAEGLAVFWELGHKALLDDEQLRNQLIACQARLGLNHGGIR